MSRCANMFLEATANTERHGATMLSFVEEGQIWVEPVTASIDPGTEQAEQHLGTAEAPHLSFSKENDNIQKANVDPKIHAMLPNVTVCIWFWFSGSSSSSVSHTRRIDIQ